MVVSRAVRIHLLFTDSCSEELLSIVIATLLILLGFVNFLPENETAIPCIGKLGEIPLASQPDV